MQTGRPFLNTLHMAPVVSKSTGRPTHLAGVMRAHFPNTGKFLLSPAVPAPDRINQPMPGNEPSSGLVTEQMVNNGLQVLQQLVDSGVPAPQAAHLVQLMILQTLPTSWASVLQKIQLSAPDSSVDPTLPNARSTSMPPPPPPLLPQKLATASPYEMTMPAPLPAARGGASFPTAAPLSAPPPPRSMLIQQGLEASTASAPYGTPTFSHAHMSAGSCAIGQLGEMRAPVIPLLSAVAVARGDPRLDPSAPRVAAELIEGESADRSRTSRTDSLDPIDPETAGGNRLAPFLKKLFNLVSESETDDVVHWIEDGTAFSIDDPRRLAIEVLPRYFKHNKLGSFTQQLHTYGFARTSAVQDEMIFSREFFRRNAPEELYKIRRGRGVDDALDETQQLDGAAARPATEGGLDASSQARPPTLPVLTGTLRESQQALASVQARFEQHARLTQSALIQVGDIMAQHFPAHRNTISEIVNSVQLPASRPPYPSTAAPQASEQGSGSTARVCDTTLSATESSTNMVPAACVRPTPLQQLTAAAEDARESEARSSDDTGSHEGRDGSHRSGSDGGRDGSGSDGGRDGSGSDGGRDGSGSDGGRDASDDRSASEEGEGEAEGSDERSDSAGRASDNSAGRSSDKSRQSGSATGSSSSAAGSGSRASAGGNSSGGGSSASAGAASSSSAEPRSEHSGSDGAPTSVSSG